MNFSIVYRLFRSPKNSIIPIQYTIQTKDYAKPGKTILLLHQSFKKIDNKNLLIITIIISYNCIKYT